MQTLLLVLAAWLLANALGTLVWTARCTGLRQSAQRPRVELPGPRCAQDDEAQVRLRATH